MSDQHAAAALTAAAVIAAILIARAAVLHQGRRGHVARAARPPRHRVPSGADKAVRSDASSAAVREAEQHVQRCWQQLRTRADPPE
ncbi:hypothetical protein [Streptomyces sp. NPDC002573]|uniref:hypothetical protein n=1 Tax=Streptomyces sp. NPDC002573 TaxID=3364651 RepID=UPI00369FF014